MCRTSALGRALFLNLTLFVMSWSSASPALMVWSHRLWISVSVWYSSGLSLFAMHLSHRSFHSRWADSVIRMQKRWLSPCKVLPSLFLKSVRLHPRIVPNLILGKLGCCFVQRDLARFQMRLWAGESHSVRMCSKDSNPTYGAVCMHLK